MQEPISEVWLNRPDAEYERFVTKIAADTVFEINLPKRIYRAVVKSKTAVTKLNLCIDGIYDDSDIETSDLTQEKLSFDQITQDIRPDPEPRNNAISLAFPDLPDATMTGIQDIRSEQTFCRFNF